MAAVVVTIGIIIATLSTPRRTSKAVSTGWQFFAGISLLTLALFLSAWLGLYQDETYRRYGRQWKEALFYIVGACQRLLIAAFPISPVFSPCFAYYPLHVLELC